MTKPTSDERAITPLASVLQSIDSGRVHKDLSRALADLVVAVMTNGRKGTLGVTFTVTRVAENQTAIQVEHTSKVPNPPGTGIFYTDQTGTLSRTHPDQPPLSGLSMVPGGKNA